MKNIIFNHHQKGMTLIEVLASVVLLAMIATAMITISKDSLTSKEEISKEDRSVMSVATALQVMDWDFTHLYSPQFFQEKLSMDDYRNSGISEPQYLSLIKEAEQEMNATTFNSNFKGFTQEAQKIPLISSDDKGMIRFLTSGHKRIDGEEKSSQFRWVQYQLIAPSAKEAESIKQASQNPDLKVTDQLVRYIDAKNPWDQSPQNNLQETSKAQVILDQVEQLQWNFWDRKAKIFKPIKDLTVEHLPLTTIKLMLKFRDLYNKEQTVEKIFTSLYRENDLKRLVKTSKEVLDLNQGKGANNNQQSFNGGGSSPDNGSPNGNFPSGQGE